MALSACGSSPRTPYSDDEAQAAQVGVANVRTWADKPDPAFSARALAAIKSPRAGGASYLALSGGGGDGAYGAGILNGWSESGLRPDFAIVSGVSTGALIAPFAFLGAAYDPVIRELYTSGVAESLLSGPDLLGALTGSSLFSNDRLRALVRRYMTPEVVAAIAGESARGRLLLVVTTNLDSQRGVIWDLGALARDGTPRAVDLLRDVLVASASIPAVFPPILIDAEAGGKTFQELHVDGTVTSSVFTLPRGYLRAGVAPPGVRTRLFVVMNAKIEPDFQLVANTGPAIGTRSFSTFIKDAAISDLADTYRLSRRGGFSFNVTYIDRDVASGQGAGFETESMRRLYDFGYARGRTGRFWQSEPPGLTARDRAPAAVASIR